MKRVSGDWAPMAHRPPPCSGCATCRGTGHDLVLAALVVGVFIVVFVLRVMVPG